MKKMRKKGSKIISFMLSVIMVMTVFSSILITSVNAQTTDKYGQYVVNYKDPNAPKIQGNFMQPWLFGNWGEERWKQECEMWQQIGIEYVIMGDVANKTSDGWQVFYGDTSDVSDIFPQDCYRDNVVDNLMKYCDMYNIKVILGIGLDPHWYDFDLLTDEGTAGMLEWRAISNRIMDDIYKVYKSKYQDTFYGWYWVEELYNDVDWYDDAKRATYAKNMAKLFNSTIENIEKNPGIDADMPLLFSPHVNPNETGPFSGFSCVDLDKVEDFWFQFINQTNFRQQDILIPQSSVDHAAAKIEQLDAWTKFYANAIERSNKTIRFWSNVESFHGNDSNVVSLTEPDHAYSRPLDVFTKQIDIVSKYCDVIFSFAYSHFYSPYLVIPGYHESYLYWLENGELEKNKPIGPNKIRTQYLGDDEDDEHGLQLTFSGMWDDFGVGRINIYKNGVLIDYLPNNYQVGSKQTARNTWIDKDFNIEYSAAIYEIEVEDVSGNKSDKVSYAVNKDNANNGVQLDENYTYNYDKANPLGKAGSNPPEKYITPIENNEIFTKNDEIYSTIILDQIENNTIVSKALQASAKEKRNIRVSQKDANNKFAYSLEIEHQYAVATGVSFKYDFKAPSTLDLSKFDNIKSKDVVGSMTIKQKSSYVPAKMVITIPVNTDENVDIYYSKNGETPALVEQNVVVENGLAKINVSQTTMGNYFAVGKANLLIGDVTGDGVVNTLDSLSILKHIAELETLTEEELLRADYDGNGNISTLDALAILKFVAKL